MSAKTTPMLIVGTGAMASLFAARLSAAGIEVTLLGTWPAGLEALKQKGVKNALPDMDEELHTALLGRELMISPEKCGMYMKKTSAGEFSFQHIPARFIDAVDIGRCDLWQLIIFDQGIRRHLGKMFQ